MSVYQSSSDPLGAWLVDNLEEVSGDELRGWEGGSPEFLGVSLMEVYGYYRAWYIKNVNDRGMNLKSSTLSQRIHSIFRIKSERKRVEGERGRYYPLRFKEGVIAEIKKMQEDACQW
jgi:CRISPR/Cas system-associated exonuclease Cas4 (RecB family)